MNTDELVVSEDAGLSVDAVVVEDAISADWAKTLPTLVVMLLDVEKARSVTKEKSGTAYATALSRVSELVVVGRRALLSTSRAPPVIIGVDSALDVALMDFDSTALLMAVTSPPRTTRKAEDDCSGILAVIVLTLRTKDNADAVDLRFDRPVDVHEGVAFEAITDSPAKSS